MHTICNHPIASPDHASERTIDEGLTLVNEVKSPTEHPTCRSGRRHSDEVGDHCLKQLGTQIIITSSMYVHVHRIFDCRGKENKHWKLLRLLQKMMQIGHLKSRK